MLDLSDVSKSNIDLHIKDCGEVQIANIQFEETSVEEQKLRVELDNLEKFTIHNQTITRPITVSLTRRLGNYNQYNICRFQQSM